MGKEEKSDGNNPPRCYRAAQFSKFLPRLRGPHFDAFDVIVFKKEPNRIFWMKKQWQLKILKISMSIETPKSENKNIDNF